MSGRFLTVGVDNLARDGGGERERQYLLEVHIGLGQPYDERISIGGLEAGDGRFVVELAGLLRLLAERIKPHDLAGEEERVGRAVLRVEEAAPCESEVLRGKLAPLALE